MIALNLQRIQYYQIFFVIVVLGGFGTYFVDFVLSLRYIFQI